MAQSFARKNLLDGSTTAAATGQTLTIDAGDVTGKATYVAQLEG